MEVSSKRKVRVLHGAGDFYSSIADEIHRLIFKTLKQQAAFSMALSGGSTPMPLYRELATHFADLIDWEKVHLFFGDERFVPHDDKQSNYRNVREALIDRAPLPKANVHAIPTDHESPEDCAREYEKDLRGFFSGALPSFDLVLLGVGNDGHTASLFPNSPALKESSEWVVATESPVKPIQRISLSLPAINAARNVFFVVTGEEKHEIVKSVLADGDNGGKTYPAAMVNGVERTVWYLDEEAAP